MVVRAIFVGDDQEGSRKMVMCAMFIGDDEEKK